MIFSNKINKIPSGKNISLYAIGGNRFEFYLFSKCVQKKILEYSSLLRCTSDSNYSYNSVIKLNDNFLCVCLDNNMSIIKNE